MVRGNLLILILAVFWLGACKTKINTTSMPLGDTSQNALDWPGVYAGVVPCADCEGIATTIQLTSDKTYRMTTVYQGKSAAPFLSEGTFKWNSLGNKITLSGIENGPNQYLVGENQLFQLDMEGNRITGELAENYILPKTEQDPNNPLAGKKWILREIMDDELRENNPSIYMEFAEEGNRVFGFGGCNNFFGSYELKAGSQISLNKLGRTQKYCLGTSQIEDRIFEALESVDNYMLEGNTLSFNTVQGSTLLRFELEDGLEEGQVEDV